FGQADVTVSTVENNLRFAGQYYDSETGLHYNYHRYYDPSLGRYLRADPIGLEGGVNLYSYVYNNPLNNIDPDGELTLVGIAGGATVTVVSMIIMKHLIDNPPIIPNFSDCNDDDNTCAKKYPHLPRCNAISSECPFNSSSDALKELKRRTGVKNLKKVSEVEAKRYIGKHAGAMANGIYYASLIGKRCCEDTSGGPVIKTYWKIH
ncbi:MAG: RHS repeat-associated core domain-containing protein, partial [Sulfurovum sp.]|nr:RHS repeat-associated core domain-containing protein [Sulfurovum sp.]NNJ45456.1 RHS repeat-associated core domain-containing protein [Sulfurovum sp.]